MRISFSTLACPKWSWEKIITEACNLGYEGIEIRCLEGIMDLGQMKPFFSENIKETLEQLHKRNLEISCLDTSCRFHEKAEFEKFLREGREAIDLAQKLNCKYIRVFGDKIPDKNNEEVMLKQIAAGIDELGNYSRGTGVVVLVETHGSFSTGDSMLKLLKHIYSKEVGVLWDLTNAYIDFGEPIAETFNKVSRYIKFVHLKDAKGKHPDTKHCLFGQGDFSIREVVSLLRDVGYDGWLSLEWEKMWFPELEEPEIAVDNYIKQLKKVL